MYGAAGSESIAYMRLISFQLHPSWIVDPASYVVNVPALTVLRFQREHVLALLNEIRRMGR